MLKWFCENVDCENHMKTLTMGKVRYHMREGQLVPEGKNCPVCGKPLSFNEIIEPGPVKINLGVFASMTPEGKQAMLKKRYQDVGKKECREEKIKAARNRALKKFFNE